MKALWNVCYGLFDVDSFGLKRTFIQLVHQPENAIRTLVATIRVLH